MCVTLLGQVFIDLHPKKLMNQLNQLSNGKTGQIKCLDAFFIDFMDSVQGNKVSTATKG